MAIEISDDELELIEVFRDTVIALLRDQEIELLRRLRRKFGGEKLYFGKLRASTLQERNKSIAREYRDGASIRALADRFNLSPTHVHRIVTKER
jgi:Mor family transcriptional regulator